MQHRFTKSLIFSIGVLVGVLWVASGVLLSYLGSSMRESVREQILSRDAYVLSALSELEAGYDDNTILPLQDRWLSLVQSASELRDILGVRVTEFETAYSESLPVGILAAALTEEEEVLLQSGVHIDRFIERQALDLLFETVRIDEIGETLPVVDLSLPILDSSGDPRAYVRFWMDGTSIAEEFAELDHELSAQGMKIWGLVGIILFLGGAVAFVIIRGLNASLEKRSLELERINHELELAARTSAIGAITGHLMHGLKNPLAGLRSYLKATEASEAQNAAERMQSIVNDTLMALRAQKSNSRSEASTDELKQTLLNDWNSKTETSELELFFHGWETYVSLPMRELNLISLVLKNLIQNAIDVSETGQAVFVTKRVDNGRLQIMVEDQGPGLDPTLRAMIFAPLNSSKPGGSGLALALSKQMMKSLGGDLVFKDSQTAGAVFELSLPVLVRKEVEV